MERLEKQKQNNWIVESKQVKKAVKKTKVRKSLYKN
jgi:hypothetical protein